MSRRRVAAAFAAAVLAGAAAGLLFGLLFAERIVGDPGTPPGSSWPTAYRCGVSIQPEDLDRADRCTCEPCG
jgi:hypothetical protein